MHLDQNCTKIMLMVIMICTGIVRKFYSTYFFGVTADICINIHRDVKKGDKIRDGVRGMDYFTPEELKYFLGFVYGWVVHSRIGQQGGGGAISRGRRCPGDQGQH